MKNKDFIKSISNDLTISEDIIKEIYNKYFEFVKLKIQNLELNNIQSEEELLKLKTNFNFPLLGKFGCTFKKIQAQRIRYNKKQERIKDKNILCKKD
jgi:hypothetical protein